MPTMIPTDPYVIGRGGFLLDRNGDGHPDDLAVRIVLPPDPVGLGARLWCAFVDLGARLGLETTGLPERLVLTAGESIPPDCLPLIVNRDDQPEQVRALALAGLPSRTVATEGGAELPEVTDLADLFTPAGLLRDRDGDRLPDGTRLAIVLPDPCPPEIGVAAIEFAARLGLESGGIDLPLAFVAGDEGARGAVVLDLAGASADAADGDTRLYLEHGQLRIAGSVAGVAALISSLASSWPSLTGEAGVTTEVRDVVEAIRDLVTAATPMGRAALLRAHVDEIPAGAVVRLHADDPEEIRLARIATGADVSAKGDWDEVFTFEWEARWEVDRVRELVGDELMSLLATSDGGDVLDVLVLVSEPAEIRQALQREIASLLAAAPGPGADVRVRVRSAYKAGLSWLREDVVPALGGLTGIDRVELRYAPVPASPEGAPPRLDLPIRWLQELYPGDELLAAALGLPLNAVDLVEGTPEGGAVYEVVAFRTGRVIWRETFSPRWYELPYVSLDPSRGSVLVSTGGVRVTRGSTVLLDRNLPTDCDGFWRWFQEVVLPRAGEHVREVADGAPRLADQPFFAALRVDAWVSELNESLGLREELDSSAEALHEDVYFGALDWLAAFGKAQGGDELNGPGAILPFIHVVPGEGPRARVSLSRRRRYVGEVVGSDGAVMPIAALGGLAALKVRVTGLSAGPRGLAGVEVALDLPPGVDSRPNAALLEAAAAIDDRDGAGGPRVPVTVRAGKGEPVTIMLPVPADDLSGVAPALDPSGDRQIVFGDDVPPLLARLRERPGVGVRQVGRSYRGRPLWALELTAPMATKRWSPGKLSLRKPTLLIVGRHHANEVASTTAAFLLAERLTADPAWHPLLDAVNVVMLPFANPDGAALHQDLVAEHPTWKHHAARYNAVGLEFGFAQFDEQTPYGEARARRTLWDRWLPDVIVDNHGVPSHEWSQHFAGFGSPPRFPVCYWMVQALLYGIITHPETPEHQGFAVELRRRLARAVAATPELHDVNGVYGHRYHRWGSSRVPERFPAAVEEDFLCYFNSTAPDPNARNFALRYPATTTLDWVTEVPDETAHGDHLARTALAQMVADEVTMRQMAEVATPVERVVERRDGGAVTIRLRRRRPL